MKRPAASKIKPTPTKVAAGAIPDVTFVHTISKPLLICPHFAGRSKTKGNSPEKNPIRLLPSTFELCRRFYCDWRAV
jgi:hypothetical protein